MSTQQEAQERYDKVRKHQTGSMWFAQKSLDDGLDWREHIAEYFFTQGEASGERITLERLATKASEGFDEWYRDADGAYLNIVEASNIAPHKAKMLCGWQAGRAPLLVRITELESKLQYNQEWFVEAMKKIAELERYINDKASNGFVCECMTNCSCYEAKLTDLEAQNKKLGDVVLEMVEVLGELGDILQDVDARKEIDSFTGQNAMVLMKYSADLIAQLKQERKNE